MTSSDISLSPNERAAYANGHEAGLVAGITVGIEQKLRSIQSIVEDNDLSAQDVRMLLKHMCRVELISNIKE
jgi:hypothetical protein